MPTLTLLSPHTVFSPGEAVRFGCSVLLGHHLSDFHLYKHGVSTPLVTQRAEQGPTPVELTLTDIETFHQGSYSCRYRIKSGFPPQLLSSPPSNSINITVGKSRPHCLILIDSVSPELIIIAHCCATYETFVLCPNKSLKGNFPHFIWISKQCWC